MATPDPRRGDEPDLDRSDLPTVSGSAPQPDPEQAPEFPTDDAAPAGPDTSTE